MIDQPATETRPAARIAPMEFDDYPDEEWVEDDGDEEDDLLACPSCHQPVHEDTQQCPHCGDWITPEYPGTRPKRWIWAVAVLAVIFGLLAWLIR